MDEVDGTRKFSDLRIRILNWGTLRSHIRIESELNFLRKYWKNHVILILIGLPFFFKPFSQFFKSSGSELFSQKSFGDHESQCSMARSPH